MFSSQLLNFIDNENAVIVIIVYKLDQSVINTFKKPRVFVNFFNGLRINLKEHRL